MIIIEKGLHQSISVKKNCPIVVKYLKFYIRQVNSIMRVSLNIYVLVVSKINTHWQTDDNNYTKIQPCKIFIKDSNTREKCFIIGAFLK